MPSLKDLKNRIDSVKSTRKITSAMKMVAAAKLRRAQENVESSRPYSEMMEKILSSLASSYKSDDAKPAMGPKLLVGTGEDNVHLLVVFSSDRGLCGGFNTNIVKLVKREAEKVRAAGKELKIISVNRKATDLLKNQYGDTFISVDVEIEKSPSFKDAKQIAEKVLNLFDAGEFDSCSIIYNKFQSALNQIPTHQQLIPFNMAEEVLTEDVEAELNSLYEFEPDEETVLAELLPNNIAVQMFHALLESAASEHGSRMTAMDNATRNAGDMINRLTLQYNRTRQALITKELIEIISGAEAL